MFGFLRYILNGISSSLRSFGRKFNRNFEMIFSNRFCMAQESFEGWMESNSLPEESQFEAFLIIV